MRLGRWIAASMMAIAAVMFLLAALQFIWTNIQKDKLDSAEVFSLQQIDRISNSNIVDIMTTIPFYAKLGKTEWSQGTWLIELKVNPQEKRQELWFKDIYAIVHTAYKQLNNVNRVLIRLNETNEQGGRLLAAFDIRKTDQWLATELVQLPPSHLVHDELWRQRLRISLTGVWAERFGMPDSFKVSPATDSFSQLNI